jgi:hypothetical protein
LDVIAVAKSLNNKVVGCYNLALVALHTDDMNSFLNELQELEQLISPDMYIYKNIMESGLDCLLFKDNLLSQLIVLEEAMMDTILLGSSSNRSKNNPVSNTSGKRSILLTQFRQIQE